jgi:hypothetical protein
MDVTGLLAAVGDPSFKMQIFVSEDSSQAREPTEHLINLHPETKQLTVSRRVQEPQASYRLVTDRVWMPFRGVPLRWSIPLNSSLVLNLRFPENPSVNWPLTVTIRTGPGDAIEAVFLPRHSFFYSDASLKPALASVSGVDEEEELVPDQGTPKIADLATDKTIHLELLPFYLSNSIGQQYKQYLVMENLVVCLVIAAVSALCVAIVSSE